METSSRNCTTSIATCPSHLGFPFSYFLWFECNLRKPVKVSLPASSLGEQSVHTLNYMAPRFLNFFCPKNSPFARFWDLNICIKTKTFWNFQPKLLGETQKKAKFVFFGYFYPAPPILGYLYCVFNPFLPSKIIVNITGDENGSILIFLVFGFLRFWPFFGDFGHFWGFWRFCWRLGGIGSASDLYDN